MLTLLSKPPSKLGRFEVGAKIGGGGMATVYLGRDIREDGSEELVALKVMKDELAHDEQFLAMFADEAKILARLSHPNVIQTLEYGVDGHSFIAMELLNGRTVADTYDALREEGERFDLADAAWICARVAEGLHSAHELVDEEGAPLSVIHRDVNPTNIFLTHGGEVKLIDFGLARARVRMSKSAEGIVKGKIPYLAPEQAQGKTIDRRIDVYALGTTLWEMCAMERLFKRDNDVDTLRAIREAKVPDLRERDLHFPEALWKVIELALKIDRDERYATAEEMRTDLDAFARTTGPHGPKVSTLLARLFPANEARQAKWLRDAAAQRDGTLNPPAPVPIASSSMLEVERKHPSSASHQRVEVALPLPPPSEPAPETPPPPSPSETPPPASRRSSVRPPSRRSIKPAKPAGEETPAPPKTEEPKTEEPKAKEPKAEPPKAPSDRDAVTERRARLKRTGKARRAKVPPPEDKKRLYMMVVIAVLVLIIIALLSTR
ncbi:MAG: protein kinase [Labilithrix sp.]|nr:protein kinase [Labilithrix sp.]MCW5816255.1 protein kinase [Labilithrix sp.]